MSKTSLAFPLTAAALAVLLAACGGSGSGGPDSGSAAPKAAPSVTEKAPAGPLVDATGVRGDLLLSMMDHRACHHSTLRPAASHDGPNIQGDPADVADLEVKSGLTPTNYKEVPDARWPPGPTPGFDAVCSPAFYTYAPFADGRSNLVQRTQAYSFRGTPDLSKLRPFPQAETSTPVTLSNGTVTLATEQVLRLEAEKATLISANAYSFRIDDRVPYGVLSQWRQGDTFTELMLLPAADNTKQAKLCWNVHAANVRRLHCTVWDVPEGWQRGNGTLNLEDQYVIDDRNVHPGEAGRGHLFWRGNF